MNEKIVKKYSTDFELLSDEDHQELLNSLEGEKSLEGLCKVYCLARPVLNILKVIPPFGKYVELLVKVLDNLCPQCVK